MTGFKPRLLLDARAALGEGPTWESRAGLLHWVDIHAGLLHTFNPSTEVDAVIPLGEPIGCLAPATHGRLVVALHSGFHLLNLVDRTRTLLAVPEPGLPGNRFNDGKCDPAGRFLAGSMDNAEQAASGSLYSLSPTSSLQTLLTGLRISNGLTWSPDYRTFYFIDTPSRLVMAYDYDLASGRLARPRPVVRIPEALGWPDGMTSDLDGMLWIALWGGAHVTRWDPLSGQMLYASPLAALNVTSCIFGGPQGSDLFITTARQGLTPAQLAEYPLSGGLFCLETGTCGLPTFVFGAGLE